MPSPISCTPAPPPTHPHLTRHRPTRTPCSTHHLPQLAALGLTSKTSKYDRCVACVKAVGLGVNSHGCKFCYDNKASEGGDCFSSAWSATRVFGDTRCTTTYVEGNETECLVVANRNLWDDQKATQVVPRQGEEAYAGFELESYMVQVSKGRRLSVLIPEPWCSCIHVVRSQPQPPMHSLNAFAHKLRAPLLSHSECT